MQTRAGEVAKSWFRSDRFYHTADGWWFQTREQTTSGPFTSQREADMELCLYIRRVNCFEALMSQPDKLRRLG